MAYVPNPQDPTQPTGPVAAGTAAAEFRALKAYLATLVQATGTRIPVRQCCLTGPEDANGNSATIGISATVLGVDLLATASPLGTLLNWAQGFGSGGALDTLQDISNDLVNFWGPLNVSNLSYLSADYAGPPAAPLTPTATKTLAPPQHDRTYNKQAQSVLQFAGIAGSTTFLDDFGNTWVNHGAAKVQTNQFKFGTGALGGAGGANALNGAADYISCGALGFGLQKNGSWSIRCWVQPTVLPGVAGVAMFLNLSSAVGVAAGAVLAIFNSAGSIKFAYYLSSDGATLGNIANGVQGTTTPVVGTWYFVELTYDAVAQVYRLYVNGIQEASTASAVVISSLAVATLGASCVPNNFFTGYLDKSEILPYCQHPAGTPYAVPVAAPDITIQGYSSDWFDTVNYLMRQVSAASLVAGNNPTFISKVRLYLGEATTSAGAVSAVSPYAIAGQYTAPWIAPLPAANIGMSFTHNIGSDQVDEKFQIINLTSELGYTSGQIVEPHGVVSAGVVMKLQGAISKLKAIFNTANNVAFELESLANGVNAAPTLVNWAYRAIVKRRW